MSLESRKFRGWRARWHSLFSLALLPALAAGVYAKKKIDPVSEQKRALHALERLTFGPRPGDVQAVAAYGVDKWIDQQLHPDKIDDSAMQVRLADYRTLQMSTRDMLLEFPSNPVAKAVMDGKLPMPHDPYRHAVYVSAIDRVQEKQEKKQNTVDVNPGSPTMVRDASAPIPQGSSPPSQTTPGNQTQQDRREARVIVDELASLPPEARMQRILALPVDQQRELTQGGVPPAKRAALLAGLSPEQRETVLALNHPQAVVNSEVQSAKLLRAVYSSRQLEEVLTDFWFNHFNIYLNKGGDRYLVTPYERDVIRPHALGKFKDLLVATAKSPAMLFYLDNWQSQGPDSDAARGRPQQAQAQPHNGRPNPPFRRRPVVLYPIPRPTPPRQTQPNAPSQNNQPKPRTGLNENYARELMELQTLGVNGGYTQKDVTEVARVFTGWTLAEPREGGGFVFKPRQHEPGNKIVLGHTIKEEGENEGLRVLDILAHHPSTARFISTELAQRFVSDDPPQSLINAMAKTFTKTDGDLREVLKTMFRSREFWAPEAYRARVKTPLEFIASSLRATDAEITDPQPLAATLNRMGMPLYGMLPPTGYSTKADVWVNSAALLDRMNFALALAANHVPGVTVDVTRLVSAHGTGVGDLDLYQAQLQLEQALLAGDISKQTHDTIEQQVTSSSAAGSGSEVKRPAGTSVIAGLLLGSPEFQRK